MKRSKYTESQVVFALKQAETGTPVAEVCRKMGISEATFYNWKKKFGGLGTTELRRLRQLEEENSQLKKLVADLSLDKHMLQEVLKKSYKASTTPCSRPMVNRGISHLDSQGYGGGGAGPLYVFIPTRRQTPRSPAVGKDNRDCPC